MSFYAVVPSPLTLLPFRNLLETASPPTPIHPFPLSFANLTSSLSDARLIPRRRRRGRLPLRCSYCCVHIGLFSQRRKVFLAHPVARVASESMRKTCSSRGYSFVNSFVNFVHYSELIKFSMVDPRRERRRARASKSLKPFAFLLPRYRAILTRRNATRFSRMATRCSN